MTCPNPQELSDFALGKLAEPSLEAVAQHLDACPNCQETVARLASDDTFVQKMKQAGHLPSTGTGESGVGQRSTGPAEGGIIGACFQASRKTAMNVSSAALAQSVTELEFASSAELSTIIGTLSADKRDDPQELARLLVQENKLTKFQATLLLKGQGKSLLLGDYAVLDRIGAGGMGQVFRARHRRMDRVVALKVMSSKALSKPDAQQRFQREVKAAARLIHTNIVTAFDAGDSGGAPYLVMEFVDGPDLATVLKKQGLLPVAKVLELIQQAARGLAFAHSKGVVHRDVKPGNLLVGRDGMVKILDLGLARFDDANEAAEKQAGGELTQDGDVMGTIDYMAPEQVLNTKNADAKADVYSLGCTLFRLLTGKQLYDGQTLMERVVAHREQPIPAAGSLRTEVPPTVDALIMRMVAKRPNDRPTMNEVVNTLDGIRRGMVLVPPVAMAAPTVVALTVVATAPAPTVTPTATPVPAIGKASPPRKRGSGKWIAAAAAGFLFVALGVWVVIRDKDGNEVARIKVADGSSVTVQADSDQKAATGGRGNESKQSAENAPPTKAPVSASPEPAKMVVVPDPSPPVVPSAPPVKPTPVPVPVALTSSQSAAAGNYALEFDGKSAYAIAQWASGPWKAPYCVELWVRPRSTSQPAVPFHLRRIARLRGPSSTAGGARWQLFFQPWAHNFSTTSAKSDDGWVHCAFVVNEREELLPFLQGKKSGQRIGAARQLSLEISALLLGASGSGQNFMDLTQPSEFFEGEIDEVRISSVARYEADFTPQRRFETDKDTFALYHFDEGKGEAFVDSSGNNRHGKIVGAKWVNSNSVTSSPTESTAAPVAANTSPASGNSSSNHALEFDGKLAAVTAELAPRSWQPPFTIEAWIRTAATRPRRVLQLPGIFTLEARAYQAANNAAPGGRASAIELVFLMESAQHPIRVTVDPSLGRTDWLHCAIVVDEQSATRAFVQGKLKAHIPNLKFAQPVNQTSLVLATGGPTPEPLSKTSGVQWPNFDGDIDEVRISSVARYQTDFTPQRRYEPDENTLALYHLDEGSGDTLADATGRNPAGKITGGKWLRIPQVATTSAVPVTAINSAPSVGSSTSNYALEFDGKSAAATATYAARPMSKPLTIEAWVQTVPTKDHHYVFRVPGVVKMFSDIGQAYDKEVPRFSFSFEKSSNSSQTLTGNFPAGVVPGQWVHCAMVITEKPEWLTFIQGRLVARQADATVTDDKTETTIVVGGPRVTAGVQPVDYFTGRIDELRVSSTARYLDHFQPQRRFEPDKETLCLYHFDEGSGATFADAAGNNQPGKIGGAQWVKQDDLAVPSASIVPASGSSGASTVATPTTPRLAGTTPYALLTSDGYEWTEPENLGPNVNHPKNDTAPCLSDDGLVLFFQSDRDRTSGGASDLFMCRRRSLDSPWEKAEMLDRTTVNPYNIHRDPCLTTDGLNLLLTTIDAPGQSQDLWVSTRTALTAPWQPVVKLTGPINTRSIEQSPTLSRDGLTLLFASDRDGNLDIWGTTRAANTPTFTNPFKLGPEINTEHLERYPCLSSDGRVLIFDRTLMRDNKVESEDGLYLSTRTAANAPWKSAVRLPAPLNQDELVASHAWLSRDGQELIFTRILHKGGSGNDLWVSRRVPKGQAAQLAAAKKQQEMADESAAGANPLATLTSSDWQWTVPQCLKHLSSKLIDGRPSMSTDGLTMYFYSAGIAGGMGGSDLYRSRRASVFDLWGPEENLGPNINTSKGDADPYLTNDGLAMFYASSNTSGGDYDIWMVRRPSVDAPWGPPEILPAPINSTSLDRSPAISPDGLELWFESRRGDQKLSDFWICRRDNVNAPFGEPVKAPDVINSPDNESAPFFWDGGRMLIFARFSSVNNTMVRDGLWFTRRANLNAPFEKPERFGDPSVMYSDDTSIWISPNGRTAILSSMRPGGVQFDDLWMMTRTRTPSPASGKSISTPTVAAAPIPPVAVTTTVTPSTAPRTPTGGGILGTPSLNTPIGGDSRDPNRPRVEIPDAEKLTEATKTVRELFKEDFAKKKPEELRALLTTLLTQAAATKDDTVGRYAMLIEARNLAAELGDVAGLANAVATASDMHMIDEALWLCDGVDAALKRPVQVANARQLNKLLAERLELAVTNEDYEGGRRLMDMAIAAARKTQDNTLVKSTVDRGKEFDKQKKSFDDLEKARATLANSPDNAEANLTVGRHLCFVKGDWQQGLPLLAKSDDAVLKDLAEKSLANPSETAAQVDLADAWWKASESAKPAAKSDLQAGARYWYSVALPGATGLMKVKVDQRLKQLGGAVSTTVTASPTAATSAPPASATTKSPNTASSAVPSRSEQQIGQALLALNCRVTLKQSDKLQEYNNVAAMPSGEFTVVGVRFDSNDRLGDQTVGTLKGLPNLEKLMLNSPFITDAGLLQVANLKSITSLTLDSSKVTDAGFSALKSLENLQILTLKNTAVTGSGFVNIKDLVKLKHLEVTNCAGFGDQGMRHLTRLEELFRLDLRQTQVTDTGIVFLRDLKSLNQLEVGPRTTDASVPVLSGLTNLNRLDLRNSAVTKVGVDKLKAALPKCQISF